MKKILYIPVCLLLLLSASALAQNTTVHFGYDANGNRISRILEIRRIQSDDFLAGEDNMDLVPTLDGQRETWGGLHVSVYPNPTQSRFTIRQSGTATLPIEASLYTANGILIEQRILSDNNTYGFSVAIGHHCIRPVTGGSPRRGDCPRHQSR